GVGGLDGAHARAGRGAIHPDRGQAEGLGGNDVVIDALSDVENAMPWGLDAGQSKFKKFPRGFVGLGLLRSDDCVEIDAKLGASSGEEVVVDVGEDSETEAVFELTKGW